MRKIYLMTVFFSMMSVGIFAQRNFFQTAKASDLTNARELTKTIKNINVYSLDEQAMRSYLQNAPMEFKNNGVTLPLEVPMPDGTVEVFNMVESPTLSPAIAAQNPDIKTYSGNGTKDKKSVIRLSLTSAGFNAVILNVGNETVYFESYATEKNNIYFNYFTKDVVVPNGPKRSSCQLDPNDLGNGNPETHNSHRSAASTVAAQLTTFRLAMAANGEFVAHNGGTQASGFAAVVAYVNRIKAFYRNELSVDFVLVSGTNLIYTNEATDPYTNSNQIAMLTENHENCNAVIGAENYDIGHVWGYAGSSGGGIAAFQSVCDEFSKGEGVSGEGDLNTYSQVFMDQLVYHEMGHQFGMSHSYNSSIPVCTTRNAATSVEPGSGATIMSYGFTCGTDNYFTSNQTGPILQFHQASYEQAVAFMATIECGVTTSTGNTPPVVTVPGAYTIPKSTPFALTGSASDVDGDTLSYCWEGTNIGTITPVVGTLADTSQPPFFRSYQPSTSPTRTYPILERILDGSNYGVGDKLPSVGIVTTHALTVRDNNANGGGVSNALVNVTVNGAIGPFLETTNLSGVYSSGSTQTITWSVNGTDAATPTVDILLSTDGGLTFPTVLLAATPNDGSQLVTWPAVNTTTARIKVASVGNIFFDISNTNFAILPALSANVTGTNTTSIGGSDGTATSAPSGGATAFNYNANTNFTGAPFNSTGEPEENTPLTVSTIVVPALPAGAILNSATLNLINVNAINGSYGNEVRVHLSGAYTLGATQIMVPNGGGLVTPNPAISLPGFPSAGGTINLQFSETINDPGTDATIDNAFITINYTKNGYTYLWSNGATTAGITTLVAGTYTVTVTDAAGLTAVGSYTVTDPAVSDYTITASAAANGSISPNGATTVASGANQTYTITPDACYEIADVLVDGVSQGAVETYTFSNVTTDHTISATFTSTATTNITTASECNSYTWANNGQTYTTSGTYTGTTTNCVTEQLVLTITPGAFNTTTVSECNTYTWANNGQTYTTSGTYNGTTTNCVTEQLVLTITPGTFNTTTVSECNSYTWANNGQTYTTSGTYTGTTTNCVTEQLVLTITPGTFNTTTVSECNTYIWANNGQTYTTSGTYNGTTTNCVTEQLVLTITPSSTNTTTASACGSYVWTNNGQTYTTSGTYTGTTTNCVTEQLVLTINNATTNGNLTISSATPYTWAGPLGSGLTYSTSGTYTFTSTNANGCPNLATLNLTITGGPAPTVNTFNLGTSCGATISSLSVTIIAGAVPGATMYTFRITNMATTASFIVNRPVNSFALSNYAGITLGTQYQIEVSVNGGANYGTPCIVNTPSPTSTIGAQCGTTLTSMAQWIYATTVATVTGYRFQITNTVTNAVEVYTAPNGLNKFNFNQLPAAFRTAGTVYAVEVALRNTNGTYLPYGAACNVTTPGNAPVATKISAGSTDFSAIAYPNPFAENFMFDVKTATESNIEVKVYDMVGRQIENSTVDVSDINGRQFGEQYPSGVYNVVLSQGENTQILRVIKR